MVTIRKGKGKKGGSAKKPFVAPKKQKKIKLLRKDEKALQKQIAEEGLSLRAEAPKGNVSLVKDDAEAFRKKNKSLKKKVLSAAKGKVFTPNKTDAPRSTKPRSRGNRIGSSPGMICITNLPHGFFEKQLEGYFSQFGDIKRVHLVRSKRTGRSCGYAYIEFRHEEVANISAKAMNNYLTFGKIMKCMTLPYSEPLANSIFDKERFEPKTCPKVLSRAKAIEELNMPRTEEQIERREKRIRSNLHKKLKLLRDLGVNVNVTMVVPQGQKKRPKMKAEDKENKKMKGKLKAKGKGKTKENEVKPKVEESNATIGSDATPDSNILKETEVVSNKKVTKKRKSLTPQTPKAQEPIESDTSVKTPKKKKLDSAANAMPKTKGTPKTPKGQEPIESDVSARTPKKKKLDNDANAMPKTKGTPKTPKPQENKESDVSTKTPKKKKLDNAASTTPKATGTPKNKKSKTPKGSEEPTTDMKKAQIVFEADESDDEISFKTPAYAMMKWVKITSSSPASRVTGLPNVKANSTKKTPKKSQGQKKAISPRTPVANKKTLQNRRKSMQGTSVQKSSKTQKRLSV